MFTDEEIKVQEDACKFILENRDVLIKEFVLDHSPLPIAAVSIFMSGSPGAGKTEFSRNYMPTTIGRRHAQLVQALKRRGYDVDGCESVFVRIDADEIREFLPQYVKTSIENGTVGNAHIVQKAVNKGLDLLRAHCLSSDVAFLHDGTFGNYKTMRKLVKQSLADGRKVIIFYIYLDPKAAWAFTKAREVEEGRNIIPENFINQYFDARANVMRIKNEFDDQVQVNCVVKDETNEIVAIKYNVPDIDTTLNSFYKSGKLHEYTREELNEIVL